MDEFEEDPGAEPGLGEAGSADLGTKLAGDHGKMLAFQAAIKAVLERQLESIEAEARESGQLVVINEKETQEAARKLHNEQKSLVLEEDNVRGSSKKLGKFQNKRERREKENKTYKIEVEKFETEIELKNVENEDLRSRVNDLTGHSLHLQVQRLDIENQVGVDQVSSQMECLL